jgi:hypothetical protein
MLGFFVARALDRTRRHLAALLFEAARLAIFASIRAFHRGLLSKRLLRDAMQVSSALNRSAYFIVFGTRPRRRRRS